MDQKYIDFLGYEPDFLNESHQKSCERCLDVLIEQRKHPISVEQALERHRRNEEMLSQMNKHKMGNRKRRR